MRKIVRLLFLTCVMLGLMSLGVYAMDAEVEGKDSSVEITPYSEGGEVIAGETGDEKTLYDNPAYYSLTFTDERIEQGGQYLVLMVSASDPATATNPTITEDRLIYIDQVQASTEGEVTFDKIYPMALKDSVILLAGEGIDSSPMKLAYVDVQGLLGDVNGDGNVNIIDVSRLLNHVNGSNTLDDISNCDVNGDSAVNIIDVSRLLNHVNGSNTLN